MKLSKVREKKMSLEREIAVMIAEALDLEGISFDDVDTEESLCGEGLFLDSILRFRDSTDTQYQLLKH
jgi:hypothetical protein